MNLSANSSSGPAAPGGPSLALVPVPAELSALPGRFGFGPDTTVVAEGEAAREGESLIDALAPAMGWRLKMAAAPSAGAVVLRIDPSAAEALGDEGYRLEVAADRVTITAARPAGLFYGGQTLRQLLPPAVFRRAATTGVEWAVPCVSITDRPRFGWRGLLLDTARHFMPKSGVLKLIDAMALHKLNTLQLHLTDDQGWRIQIRKYPRLTEVGGWREETLLGHPNIHKPWKFDGRRHGGFYTQEDIREIVGYAADRHINIVPEIEMPGHARAAIAAYPELGCHPDQPVKPWTTWGVCPDIYVPTEQTVVFLQDVLTEVLELFPGRFVHIGGDEATKEQWKASPVVQARIRELGLKDEAEMQSWFVRRMDKFLSERGRRLLGWDEILEGGLAPGAVVMSWRGEKGGIAAARAGHDVVMTPTSHTYLDYYQGPAEKEPQAICCTLLLETVYHYEPVPRELEAAQAGRVLGSQGQLWSEYIPDGRHAEYMAFPRACALSEVLWSPRAARDYGRFLERLRGHLPRLDVLDVNYRRLD
jgi:hexosaminidase